MMLIEQKSGLFDALAREALFVSPVRTEITIADLRELVASFVNRHRAHLLEGAREQDLDLHLFARLDAIEAFVLYDHIEPLLGMKQDLSRLFLQQLQSEARSLIEGSLAMHVRSVIECGGLMVSRANDRAGCWDFVREQTMDRMWRIKGCSVSNAQELLSCIRWASSELGLCEQRLLMQQETAYYFNRLPRGYEPICL